MQNEGETQSKQVPRTVFVWDIWPSEHSSALLCCSAHPLVHSSHILWSCQDSQPEASQPWTQGRTHDLGWANHRVPSFWWQWLVGTHTSQCRSLTYKHSEREACLSLHVGKHWAANDHLPRPLWGRRAVGDTEETQGWAMKTEWCLKVQFESFILVNPETI